jgi:hypothetical protein
MSCHSLSTIGHRVIANQSVLDKFGSGESGLEKAILLSEVEGEFGYTKTNMGEWRIQTKSSRLN